MKIQEIISYLSTFSPLIPIFVGIKERKSLLWLYAVAGFVSNFLMVVVLKGLPQHMVVVNVFIVVEYLILYTYYKRQFHQEYKLAFACSYLAVIASCVATFYKSGYGFSPQHAVVEFNWIGSTILCFSYIILAVCGFLYIIKQQKFVHIERSPFFIVNTAFIVYYSTVFLVFLFSQYLVGEDKIAIFWRFLEFMNIIKYILLAYALRLENKQRS